MKVSDKVCVVTGAASGIGERPAHTYSMDPYDDSCSCVFYLR